MKNELKIEEITEDVCGLYDCDSNVVYLETGKVIRFRNNVLQCMPNTDQVFEKLNRWARNNGHIQKGEVIGVIN